jgi:hypothetical protein
MAEGGFSAHEKKSARSLIVCFLALECGYWQVSQFENWVSSVCMVPPENDFLGEYNQEVKSKDTLRVISKYVPDH